jgi:hypothetical protein
MWLEFKFASLDCCFNAFFKNATDLCVLIFAYSFLFSGFDGQKDDKSLEEFCLLSSPGAWF